MLLLGGNYLFAQPLTSTSAGCAITVGTQYRVYQIITTSFNGRPTYTGTGSVRYTTWTDGSAGIDKARLTCLTLNTGASNACYVKTGTGTTSTNYTSGTSTTFTVNTGTSYNENGAGSCTLVPLDDHIWLLISIMACFGFIALKHDTLNFSLISGN